MTLDDLSKAKDKDIPASVAAMNRAAAMARKIAVQTETGIIVVENEKIVLVTADELRKKDPM